jgi:hypothetical protein
VLHWVSGLLKRRNEDRYCHLDTTADAENLAVIIDEIMCIYLQRFEALDLVLAVVGISVLKDGSDAIR